MELELIRSALGWGALINIAVLLYWFAFLTLAHDWTYKLHARWFKLSEEKFDRFHYLGLALYKTAIIAFYIVPYIALSIVLD